MFVVFFYCPSIKPLIEIQHLNEVCLQCHMTAI